MTNLVAMSRRISDLEEENRALREVLECAPVNLHVFLGLSPTQSRVLRELERVSPNVAPHQRLRSILDTESSSADELLKVCVFHINRLLRSHGFKIRNEWGVGYYIDVDSKARLDALLEDVANREKIQRSSIPWRAHV